MEYRFSDQPGTVIKILILFGLIAFGLIVYLVSRGSLLPSLLLPGIGFLGINQKLSRLSLHDDSIIASTTFYTFTVNYKDVLAFGSSFYPSGAVYILIRLFRFLPFFVFTGQVVVESSVHQELARDDILAFLKERAERAIKA